MPTVAVNLADVQAFESLPVGSYYAEIAKITYRAAKSADKHPQMMVSYLVIDGDHVGRTQNEFLSFSPKALFRMKRWFNKFGLGDIPELNFDDDTDELQEPDLYGYKVIFAVSQDRNDTTRFNTDLVSVEDEIDEPAPAPARAAAPVRARQQAQAPEAEPEVDTEEVLEVESPAEGAETEEVPAPVAPRRAPAPARATPSAARPARRTLR